MRHKKHFLFLFIFLMMLSFAVAQETQKRYHLSLEQVSKIALHNNLDIQIGKYDVKKTHMEKQEAQAIYDTIIRAKAQYRKDETLKTSTFAPTESRENDYEVGLSQKLPTGTQVDIDLTNARDWSNSSFATSPLTHESRLGVTVTQELAKNFLGHIDRYTVQVADLQAAISRYSSLEKIEEDLASVQKIYWQLVLATTRLNIQNEMHSQAKALFDAQQEKIKDGLSELPDVIAAEANFQSRTNDVLLAQDYLAGSEVQVKLMLNIDETKESIKPSQNFLINNPILLEKSLEKAFKERRDYQRLVKDVEVRHLEVSLNKNKMWPELNLTASLIRNGLGDQFENAIEDAYSDRNEEWALGLSFEFPFQNRKARSQVSKAKINKAKSLIRLKQVERKIILGVEDKVRTANVLREVALNLIKVGELQKQKLLAEEKRFRQGRSDIDTLIRFQNDSTLAQLKATEAMFNYHVALVDLSVAEGGLLNMYLEEDI